MKKREWEAEQIRIRQVTREALIEILTSRHASPAMKLEAIKILHEKGWI